ncbi:MAG: hypothetical protein ACK4SY_07670 [Pyrobaculum sp.]
MSTRRRKLDKATAEEVRELLGDAIRYIRNEVKFLERVKKDMSKKAVEELVRLGVLHWFEDRLYDLVDELNYVYLRPRLYGDRNYVTGFAEDLKDPLFEIDMRADDVMRAELKRLEKTLDVIHEIKKEVDNSPDRERLLERWREVERLVGEIKKWMEKVRGDINSFEITEALEELDGKLAGVLIQLQNMIGVDEPLKHKKHVMSKGPLYAKMLKLYEKLYAIVEVLYLMYKVRKVVMDVDGYLYHIHDIAEEE